MFDFHSFYSHLFKGKLFIIKAGGRVISDREARANLLQDIHTLTQDGIKVLLIYGGGHLIDAAIKETGRTSLKIDGRRVTLKEDIMTIQHVMAGDLGFRIQETMRDIGLKGLCLGSLPASWATAILRSPYEGKMRFDGTLETIDATTIKQSFKGVSFMAAPCLATNKDGITVNINADNVAVELACALKSNKLIFMTDTYGVLVNGQTIPVLSASKTKQLIKSNIITGGMKVKMENCLSVLEQGTKRVHILNGFVQHALSDEIYTTGGCGTMIVQHAEKKKYELEKEKEKTHA